jgi:hypothetical protein
MSQPVGVLALRIWRSDQGETRARISTKLDVADATAPEVAYFTTVDELDEAVAVWVRRFAAATAPYDAQ